MGIQDDCSPCALRVGLVAGSSSQDFCFEFLESCCQTVDVELYCVRWFNSFTQDRAR